MLFLSSQPKVVILCGGKGTRLREETADKPKPMVPIGPMPILVHIMKIYSRFGYNDFVLALGHKGEVIKEYFAENKHPEWSIIFADTGEEAQTGARIKRTEKYIDSDHFLATYGDAVSDVDISKLVEFHRRQGTIGTMTAVHPHSKWGLVKGGGNGLIEEFVEKPQLYDYVNGGFFVFSKKVFGYIDDSEGEVLEHRPFSRLVKAGQFSMYRHEGFWHAMDTYKDYLDLNSIYAKGEKKWF